MKAIKLFAPLFFLLFTLTGWSYEEVVLQQAIDLYMLGVDGDESATAESQKLLKKLDQQPPAEPIILAYLGGTYTLQGRDAWLPWRKISHTEKGLDLIAKSVQRLKPEHKRLTINNRSYDLETKIIAAITFTQVPQFFGRYEYGVELLDEILEDSRFPQVSAERQAEIYYYAASAAAKGKQRAKAHKMANRVTELTPNSAFAQQVKVMLAELEDE